MKFHDLLKTAFGNLTRRKARTALTTVGIVVGILTIVTLVSLGIGVQREMRQTFQSVGLESLTLYPVTEDTGNYSLFGGQPPRTRLLTPELVCELEARQEVIEVRPVLSLPEGMRLTLRLGGQEVRADPWEAGPASVPGPFETGPQLLAGEELPPAEGGGLVVSEAILEPLGYGRDELAGLIRQEVELVLYAPRGESQTFPLRITGITEKRWGNVSLALPDKLEMLKWWYNDPDYLAHRGYDAIRVRARSLRDAAQVVEQLSSLGYRVEDLKTILDMVNRGMVILQTMLGSVGGLALLVASLGIANTMIMAVYERTREIGILKAVGAAPGQIRALFVVEAALIGLLGGIVGTILGWLLGKGLNRLILAILAWQEVRVQGTFFVTTWWLAAAALAFATLVGLLAGLYPAARAARLAPLEALRYE